MFATWRVIRWKWTFYCQVDLYPRGLRSIISSSLQVAWLRSSEHKFFEFINNRDPPYRNFSTPGADIDVSSQLLRLSVDSN